MPLRFRAVGRLLLGRPLRTEEAARERLSNAQALAVLSSDALSSVAYATEEILRVLALAGGAALVFSLPIAGAIVALIAIVTLSYRQTIHAYPTGGGAYTVSRDNLGTLPALIAAAALLCDYVLTASVSLTAGTAAITSAFPPLFAHRTALALAFVILITWANLRGVRESGRLFALPTYAFILSMAALIMAGVARQLLAPSPGSLPGETWGPAGPGPSPAPGAVSAFPDVQAAGQTLTAFLVLRAFASGCTALTGIEAISNGVLVFRPPEARNAARTMAIMAALLAFLFAGITWLSHAYGVIPREEETVVSQVARRVFGGGVPYLAVQASTALILLLAANTSFADFPRLASLLARDGFLPRQLANLGERLVYFGGIVTLGFLSGLIIAVFRGSTHALIPLYAVGVFTSFTLSQFGMVRHWLRERGRAWRWHAAVNGTGGAATAVVLAVIAVSKFRSGAWLVVVLIPLLVKMFLKIKAHYDEVSRELALAPGGEIPVLDGKPVTPWHNTIIIPVASLNRALAATVAFARSMKGELRAVHVAADPSQGEDLARQWRRLYPDIPLTVIPSPYRSVTGPLLRYIHGIERRKRDHLITVLLPEFVVARWWHHFLHNQTAFFLKAALLFQPGVIVISVPYHLHG